MLLFLLSPFKLKQSHFLLPLFSFFLFRSVDVDVVMNVHVCFLPVIFRCRAALVAYAWLGVVLRFILHFSCSAHWGNRSNSYVFIDKLLSRKVVDKLFRVYWIIIFICGVPTSCNVSGLLFFANLVELLVHKSCDVFKLLQQGNVFVWKSVILEMVSKFFTDSSSPAPNLIVNYLNVFLSLMDVVNCRLQCFKLRWKLIVLYNVRIIFCVFGQSIWLLALFLHRVNFSDFSVIVL